MKNSRSNSLHAKRIGPTLVPDRSRVLMRPFRPTTESIARRIVEQVMTLSEEAVAQVLSGVMAEFGSRHHEVERFFHNRYARVIRSIPLRPKPSLKRQALIGSYFTHE